jgi:hypothetical protein
MSRRHVSAVLLVLAVTLPACANTAVATVECRLGEWALVLSAQSVPSATMIPCIAELPAGWSYSGSEIGDATSRFWLDSDRAGLRAVEVELTATCLTAGALEIAPAPDEAGARVFTEPIALRPALRANRYIVFPGGCVTYRYRFQAGASTALSLEAEEALGFFPRSALVEQVREDLGQTLCGAGAPPCEG